MKKTLFFVFGFLSLFFVLAAFSVPSVAFAATTKKVVAKVAPKKVVKKKVVIKKAYKDEHIAISNSASRCNTVAIRKMHDASIAQGVKDGKTYQVTTSTKSAFGAAYATYTRGLVVGWEAMQEPYCGFGSMGVSAAQKSYQKTLTRLRTNFLAAVKKAKAIPVAVTSTKTTP